jgi:hypothetical protein
MKLRRLNNTGISHFCMWLNSLRENGKESIPFHLLDNEAFSVEFDMNIEVENRPFVSRYELGAYLIDRLGGCNQRNIENDTGLWTWLALFWFEQLCPTDSEGARKPRRNDNYILSDRHRDYHRHAIRTTWLFVREHGATVHFVFSNPLSKRGELTEQLTASPYFLNCKGLIQAAQYLYDDPIKGTWKRGAASKGAGVVRRLVGILNQFMLTYDLHSMDKDAILSVLPAKEFAKFMNPTSAY